MMKKSITTALLVFIGFIAGCMVSTCHSEALATDPLKDASARIGTLSPIGLTADNLAPPPATESFMPDTFNYRVVYRWHGQRCIRVRQDVVRTTVFYHGTPLSYPVSGRLLDAVDLSNSDLTALMMSGLIPDTLNVDVKQSITRTERRLSGRLTSGPRLVHSTDDMVDLDRLYARHQQYAERLRRLARR